MKYLNSRKRTVTDWTLITLSALVIVWTLLATWAEAAEDIRPCSHTSWAAKATRQGAAPQTAWCQGLDVPAWIGTRPLIAQQSGAVLDYSTDWQIQAEWRGHAFHCYDNRATNKIDERHSSGPEIFLEVADGMVLARWGQWPSSELIPRFSWVNSRGLKLFYHGLAECSLGMNAEALPALTCSLWGSVSPSPSYPRAGQPGCELRGALLVIELSSGPCDSCSYCESGAPIPGAVCRP